MLPAKKGDVMSDLDTSTIVEPETQVSDAPSKEETVVADIPAKLLGENGEIDRDKVVKQFIEQEKALGKLGQEVGDLRKQAKQDEKTDALIQAMNKVAENTAQKAEPTVSYEEWVASRLDAWDDTPGLRDIETAARIEQYRQEDRNADKAEAETKFQAMLAEIEALKGSVKKTTPEYQAHAQRIAKLLETVPGLTEDQAIAIARDESQQSDLAMGAPVSIPNGRKTETAPVTKGIQYFNSPEERQEMVAKIGEEKTARVELNGIKRIKASMEKNNDGIN